MRRAAVAGLFYPDDPAELRASVSAYLRQAPACSEPPPKALIVPHAGYRYSGAIAAAAYASIAARAAVRRVVLFGPSHRVYLRGMAVPAADAFETPLGTVPIDAELKAALRARSGIVEADLPHAEEHCLEVQLPFLQALFGDFTLLPVVLGSCTPRTVAEAYGCAWNGDETLIIASSDLSHYHDYETARRLDAATRSAILRRETTLSGEQACGAVALNGLLQLAQDRSLEVTHIAHCNSGDTSAERSRVVGYAAFALHEPRSDALS